MDPAFWEWFGSSKVCDPQGKPEVVYHGSIHRFEEFDVRLSRDIGCHFGSYSAAISRVVTLNRCSVPEARNSIYEVYLSIQDPFVMEDLEVWDPILMSQIAFGHKNAMRPCDTAGRKEQFAQLRRLLLKEGYDGIRYQNSIEDKGSTSWIIFDPRQAKSVNNRGTWSWGSKKMEE
ncbi:MAG: ADP-ribosyltransferase-containing protein [Acidiferrobacterales bacterium]